MRIGYCYWYRVTLHFMMIIIVTLLTLGAHAQLGLRQLGLSVCLQHLTSRASVRPEIDVMYSTKKGQNNCGFFSKTAPLQRSTTSCIVRLSVRSAIFTPRKTHMHIIQPRIMLSCLRIVCCWLAATANAKLFCLGQL